MIEPVLTCKFCRFTVRPERGLLGEHGPVDNRCKGSGRLLVDSVIDHDMGQYLKFQERRRKRLEGLVWKHKHADFKGKREDGTKCVLKFVSGSGTCSVPISSLTDAECLDMIPSRVREAEGLSA